MTYVSSWIVVGGVSYMVDVGSWFGQSRREAAR